MLGDDPATAEFGDAYNDARATASDNVDGDITDDIVTVNPVDANTVGAYTVTYNVVDNATNAADEVTRTVAVVDTTAPVISVPADFTVQATSLAGAWVNYTATAWDFVGVTSFVCGPTSGDQFDIGATPVTCDALDAAANASQSTFTVTVE